MSGRRAVRLAWDAGVCALVVSLVSVPVPSHLAGRIFANDLFFHWDHFVVAPALAYRHGMALGTDVYAQYGTGWPVLLDVVSGFVRFSHQNVIRLAVAYGCLYYAGLYLLLRAAVKSRLLATAGTALALQLSLFSPLVAVTPRLYTLWQWPSQSPLRTPLDVWFLGCLLAHARTGRRLWSVSAGAVVGLAILLETDTGLLLAGTLGAYGCGWLLARGDGRRGAATALASAAALLLVWASGLAAGSQGTLFTRPGDLLSGWISGVTNSSSRGVGAIYFNTFLGQEAEYLPWVLAGMAIGFFAVGHAVLKLLHRRATPLDLFLGCVGLYALGLFTLFVWRSLAIRLTLVAVPLCLLAMVALAQGMRTAAASFARRAEGRVSALAAERVLALAALVAACALLVGSPSLRAYPNLWWVALRGWPAPGMQLIPERGEVSGLAPPLAELVRSIREAVAKVEAAAARGEETVVLDWHKTLICLEAGVPPWPGEAAVYMNTWTRRQAAERAAALESRLPRNVIIRHSPPERIRDTWLGFQEVLQRRYRKAETFGVFDRWERRDGPEGAGR